MILPSENDEGRYFVPELPMAKEKISICQKQVLISFTLSGKLLAFLGPYLTSKSQPKNVNNFYSCYPVIVPSVFEERFLDLSFMEKHVCVFRSAPPTQSKEYLVWLNKVEIKR